MRKTGFNLKQPMECRIRNKCSKYFKESWQLLCCWCLFIRGLYRVKLVEISLWLPNPPQLHASRLLWAISKWYLYTVEYKPGSGIFCTRDGVGILCLRVGYLVSKRGIFCAFCFCFDIRRKCYKYFNARVLYPGLIWM